MCNYFYFRTLYAEVMLLVIHAQTLQYVFLCATTLRTCYQSYIVILHTQKYVYQLINNCRQICCVYNVKKNPQILRTNTALFILCMHNDVLILCGLLVHFVQNPN